MYKEVRRAVVICFHFSIFEPLETTDLNFYRKGYKL